MWPQITAGIAKSGPIHTSTMARMPSTRLHTARLQFCGAAGIVGTGGASFIVLCLSASRLLLLDWVGETILVLLCRRHHFRLEMPHGISFHVPGSRQQRSKARLLKVTVTGNQLRSRLRKINAPLHI